MTDDLSNMRPRDVTDMLNSTPLGEVISERQLLRHRCNGGKDVGEGKRVNFLKYSAWLVDQYYGKLMKNDYGLKKLRAAERSAMLSEEAREIGQLPPVVNLERKKKACEDFLYFCETYFPKIFYLPWSEDHRKVIDRILRVISDGGLFAMGMPHGCGKSTIMQVACLWAVLSGRSGFAVLVAASVERAHKLLGDIKLWLMTNELLHEDFPEITVAIRALDDNPNRQRGQTYQGVPTRIIWSDNKITFPTIPGSAVSSGTIACGGLLGSDLRGMNHAKADGVVMRPDLIFIDDPQTRESAWSPKQVERRRHIIYTDILGMGGPSQNLSVILACRVIRPGDLADEMLNRDKNPSWRGMRTKMIYEFPKNKGLWEEYRTIRNECLRKEGDISKATEFYVANREAMDEGAVVAWPERFKPDEKSAIQSAMNLKFRDESAFYAECQNEPSGEVVAEELLSAEDIAAKVNGYDRSTLPGDTKFVTAFIDIHNRALYWMICGWTEHFGGAVIDYGTWPEQDKPFFKLSEIRKTLRKKYECSALEDRISKGLEDLCEHIFKRKYRVEGGGRLPAGIPLPDRRQLGPVAGRGLPVLPPN